MSDGPPAEVVARLRAAGCVFAEDEARLLVAAAGTPAELDALIARRASGMPLEHLLGWAEFCGLRIAVDPGVFVPRRRTQFLVRQAAALVRRGAVVVDLCCGSGAVGAALAAQLGSCELHAVDVDPAAVRCASRNVGPGAAVYQGDLYEPLPRGLHGRVDVIVANAPYVPSDEIALMPAEARDHEHRCALDGGSDGLAVHRRVAADAAGWLAPGGHLLIETSVGQASRTAAIITDHGMRTRIARSAEYDATVAIGIVQPAPSSVRR